MTNRIVCVTGASGYIASHIVAQLLEKGYTVRGTVRDPANLEKVGHLHNLPGATPKTLKLFPATLGGDESGFDEAISGSEALIHGAANAFCLRQRRVHH